MGSERRSRSQSIWDTIPRPAESILPHLASETKLDEDYFTRMQRHDEIIRLNGYEAGSVMALEEDIELLIDRLNAYERYADDVERWISRMRRKYLLIDRFQGDGLSIVNSNNTELQDIRYSQEDDDHQRDA